MTKEEALKLLTRRRSGEWNAYRKQNPAWMPDLTSADLTGCDLVPENKPPFDLSGALLMGAKFPDSRNLIWNDRSVDLTGALVDADTVFPADFDSAGAGAKFVTKAELGGSFSSEAPVAFISYAWADEDVVLAIDQWLRLKRVSTKIDRRDFFAGSRIRDEIIRVMQECNAVIVMYSATAKDKPWPQFERELAADIEMEAKAQGKQPPRIIYVVVDDTPLPSVTERARIAVLAKGKRFELVCEEIYHAILQLPKEAVTVDLDRWKDYVF